MLVILNTIEDLEIYQISNEEAKERFRTLHGKVVNDDILLDEEIETFNWGCEYLMSQPKIFSLAKDVGLSSPLITGQTEVVVWSMFP